MGLFKAKKKIYVSSVTYNLAGDEADAIDYLNYTVTQAVLNNNDVAKGINDAYMGGQGVKAKLAYNYARDYYYQGLPYSKMQIARIMSTAPIKAILEAANPTAAAVTVLSAQAGSTQYEWWAIKYLIDNYGYSENDGKFYNPPAGVGQDADVTYDIDQDDVITITFSGDGSFTESFTPTDYDSDAYYLQATYITFDGVSTNTSTETRDTEEGDEAGTTTTSVSYWQDGEYYTAATTKVVTLDEDAGTTTIVTTIEVGKTSFNKYFLYQFGTNEEPTLEAMFSEDDLASPYYPSVPMRIWNTDLADEAHQNTAQYKTSKKLLNKMGIKIQDIADSINDNSSIKDIDFAYIVFGVNLNTTLKPNKQYIYYFVKYLQQIQTTSEADWLQWVTLYDQWDTEDPDATDRKTYIPAPAVNSLKVYMPRFPRSNYNMTLQWQFVKSTTFAGVFEPGAIKGDVSVEPAEDSSYQIHTTTDADNSEVYTVDGSVLVIKYQVTENTWDQVTIVGFLHKNFVYKGKSVDNSIADAFGDEDDTGFLLPLNYDVIHDMGLVKFTNMSYNTNHIVFNCYKVVKQKWYQSGVFKVVIVVIAIVVTAISYGTASSAAYGAVVALSTAIGSSILVAAIILATGSVVLGMLIGRILDKVAVGLFGEEFGHIIGAIATVIVMYYGGSAVMNSFGSTAASTAASNTTMFTADNILKATAGVGKLGQAYMEGQAAVLQQEAQSFQDMAAANMEQINDLIAELSQRTGNIDTSWFMQDTIVNESPSTFLTRTLLTGSEIVDVTHGLIHNYTDIGLSLPSFNK